MVLPELYVLNTMPEIIFKPCGSFTMQIYVKSPRNSVLLLRWRTALGIACWKLHLWIWVIQKLENWHVPQN